MKFLYPDGKAKSLTFSYDDGQIFDIRLAELLRSHGMKGTFNLNSGNLDDKDGGTFVNKNKLKEIYEGHEIAVHGVEHKCLTGLTDNEIIMELVNDRQQLEKLTGRIVQGMAYAFGAYDGRIIRLCKSAGIKYSRTVGENAYFDLPAEFLAWDSTCHHNNNLIEKGREFLECPDWKSLPCMYVWGHSYEFGDDWSVIEEFADLMQGKDDIWYATNGEIYDYITATKRLEYSANGELVHNPTAQTIWYRAKDWSIKTIKPGETAYI